MTNPISDVAYGGTSHVFECTIPDSTPIGDDHHEIFWLYKGPADSDAKVTSIIYFSIKIWSRDANLGSSWMLSTLSLEMS